MNVFLRLLLCVFMPFLCLSNSLAVEPDNSTLNICNKSGEVLYFAIAHKQVASVENDNWKVQGIYDVSPHYCLSTLHTKGEIQAYLSLIKVTDGKAQIYKGNYFASSDFAQDTDQDICMSYKSFKYFTSEKKMGNCQEGFFKSKSFIYLKIERNSVDSSSEHRLFIE